MVTMTGKGTISEDIPENLRMKLCLSSEDVIRLGESAIKIEKYYRSKRDIEWGLKDGKIFLFQSRPVTSGTEETDLEIEHELDAALRIENDYFSVSNVAEVLPGAMTYLSKDLLFKQNSIGWQEKNESDLQSGVKARYFDLTWFTMHNHAMFNVTDLFHQSKPGKLSGPEKVNMVAFFGRVLDTEEIVEIAYDRFSGDRKSWWVSVSGMLKSLLFSGQHLKDTQKYYANYRLPLEKYQTAKDLFYGLATHCCDRSKSLRNLLKCTQGSALWNMMILTTLSQDKEEIDNDAYTDFSKLVTTTKGNVESADVPSTIERLAADISESIQPEKFKAMKTEDAVKWLKETPSLAGKRFFEFLTRHGHRCIKEYDIYSTTWESDPRSLVQLLQNLVGTKSKENAEKKNKSVLQQILGLKTSLSIFSKLKLLFFVPMSRKCVQNREAAKSLYVKVLDSWRKGYWELAKRMVSEGRIPDEKLLFFMTLDEIQELLESRSPKILSKAYHRQRLYPKMNKYRFAEIMRGIPRPINENEKEDIPLDGSLSMQGIPVSAGVAKGFLRVAVTIDEATSLQTGEILLAYGTDIGWTPYFPCLAGVATELGGLVSHGAVISREYGLPCVVGLHGATKKFCTGDYVLLDGNKGLLQKIPPTIES